MNEGTVYVIQGLDLLGDEDGLSAAGLDRLPLEASLVEDLRQRISARRAALEVQAHEALAQRNVGLFLLCVSSRVALRFFIRNTALLQTLGLYEAGLLEAYTAHPASNRLVPAQLLQSLFRVADPAKLRAGGDPFPGPGPYQLYRGVSGRPKDRRVRGLSWTLDRDRATWFAHRFGLEDPAVYTLTVPESRVLAYSNERHEQEMLVLLRTSDRPRRLDGEAQP